MGAHDFWNTSKTRDPQQAYDHLVSDALSESGHDPYNGTISTTRGCVVKDRTPVPSPLAEMRARGRITEHQVQKWGPAEAVAVGVYPKLTTKRVTVTIDASDGQGELRLEDVAKAAGVSIERVASYTLVASRIKHRTAVSAPASYTRRWEVERRQYATKTEAVKAAKELLAQRIAETQQRGRAVLWTREIEVKPVLVAAKHVTVSPQITSWTAKIEVQIGQGEIKFDHWLFYGLAAC